MVVTSDECVYTHQPILLSPGIERVLIWWIVEGLIDSRKPMGLWHKTMVTSHEMNLFHSLTRNIY